MLLENFLSAATGTKTAAPTLLLLLLLLQKMVVDANEANVRSKSSNVSLQTEHLFIVLVPHSLP